MEVDQNASGNSEQNISDVEVQSSKKDTVQYDTYKKVLGEKKKMQSQFTEMEQKLKSFEEEKMVASGQKDELIASLRGRLEEKESSLANAEKAFAWRQLNGSLSAKAKEMGCVNPEKLIRLLDDNDINSIELDSGYMVNNKDVEAVLAKAKEENDFLFKSSKVNVVDQPPVNHVNTNKTTVESMSVDELEAKIRLLDSQGE